MNLNTVEASLHGAFGRCRKLLCHVVDFLDCQGLGRSRGKVAAVQRFALQGDVAGTDTGMTVQERRHSSPTDVP